ncbi:MAG: hypothetical protein ABL921_23990 [Pirellula sp.]
MRPDPGFDATLIDFFVVWMSGAGFLVDLVFAEDFGVLSAVGFDALTAVFLTFLVVFTTAFFTDLGVFTGFATLFGIAAGDFFTGVALTLAAVFLVFVDKSQLLELKTDDYGLKPHMPMACIIQMADRFSMECYQRWCGGTQYALEGLRFLAFSKEMIGQSAEEHENLSGKDTSLFCCLDRKWRMKRKCRRGNLLDPKLPSGSAVEL